MLDASSPQSEERVNSGHATAWSAEPPYCIRDGKKDVARRYSSPRGSEFVANQGQDHEDVREDENYHPHAQIAVGGAVGRAVAAFAAEQTIAIAPHVSCDTQGEEEPKAKENRSGKTDSAW